MKRITCAVTVLFMGVVIVASPGTAGAATHTLYGAGVKWSTWNPITSAVNVLQASNNATYYTDSAGQAWAYGAGGFGDLGDGSMKKSWTPQPVIGLSNVVAIGDWHYGAAAITSTGQVYGWGDDTHKEFCDGGSGEHDTPELLPSLVQGASQVAGGNSHNVYLVGNTVITCGESASGNNQFNNYSTVTLPAASVVTEITSGNNDSCALLNPTTVTGTNLYCWGLNKVGQLGNGATSTKPVRTPTPVAGDHTFVAVSMGGGSKYGEGSAIAVDNAGQVWTWGDNQEGELGNGTMTPSDVPVPITFPVGFTSVNLASPQPVSSGTATMGVVDTAGNLWVWGYVGDGGLGNGVKSKSGPNVTTPLEFPGVGAIQVSMGNHVSAYVGN